MMTPQINCPQLWRDALPTLDTNANKYSRGHAVVFGGYPQTGAARMAARAAARIGAGLTTIAVSSTALPIYAAALESIIVRSISATTELDEILSDQRVTALLIGPGAGVDQTTRDSVLRLLDSGKPVVLDADALTVFQDEPQELFNAIKHPCVLTPHDGEFARIFSSSGTRENQVQMAAHDSHAVVVLKGSQTLIAADNSELIVNTNAPPTLATAGSGDVLAGMILGLLAQGMQPQLASAAAVWMHARAAEIFGRGLIAEDLPDLLPMVWRELDAS